MNSITKDIKEYVFLLFQNNLPTNVIYHNFSHTLRVVKKIKELIKGEEVLESEALLLEIAAWFHDSGFINGSSKHEENGVLLANNFLGYKFNLEGKGIKCFAKVD